MGVAAPVLAQTAEEDTARALHLLSRATFGVRPADLADVLAVGPDTWLIRQLEPAGIDDRKLADRLAPYSSLTLPIGDLYEWYLPPQQLIQQLRVRVDSTAGPGRGRDTAFTRQDLPPELRRELQQRSPQRLLGELVHTKILRSAYSERQLEEVMTDFWFNHFNVHFGKALTRYMIADYEREAIRPHVFGRFEDMLLATAKHPAMLFYLDNWTSIAPDSLRSDDVDRGRQMRRIAGLSDRQKDQLVRSGRLSREQLRRIEEAGPMLEQANRRLRDRGLNENYARELLELHTLGVDGGYTQQDVIELARVLTGWSFVPPRQPGASLPRPLANVEPGTFVFNAFGHDTHEKVVLGERVVAGGVEEGEAVIRMLARHPATAHFLATKLVERFVSDAPDPAFVDELANVYLRTDGDLREVTRALFTSDHFYTTDVRGAKVKTPFELVVSAVRVTDARVGPSRKLVETLRAMGHLPYNEPAPTGFPAVSEDWINSGAMLARMNFALDLAAGRVDGVRLDAARVDLAETKPDAALDAVLARLLPGTETEALATAIRADLERNVEAESPGAQLARAIGLALGSPEFQRR